MIDEGHIGVDESGKGDYFGPLVIAACYVGPEHLAELEGVETVHDLHIWPLSTTETALTAHLVAPDVASTDSLLQAARQMLHDRFAIEHCTLQVERTHLEDTRCC